MTGIYYKKFAESYPLLKTSIIDAIGKSAQSCNNTATEYHYTDYNIDLNIPRLYEPFVMPAIMDHMRAFERHYDFKGIELVSMWFQSYPQSGFHDWHVHPSCHFTNIFYIKLPDKMASTQIKNPYDHNRPIIIDIDEGDILTIPGFFPHCSPILQQDSEKIIISFNTNII